MRLSYSFPTFTPFTYGAKGANEGISARNRWSIIARVSLLPGTGFLLSTSFASHSQRDQTSPIGGHGVHLCPAKNMVPTKPTAAAKDALPNYSRVSDVVYQYHQETLKVNILLSCSKVTSLPVVFTSRYLSPSFFSSPPESPSPRPPASSSSLPLAPEKNLSSRDTP